MVIKLFEQF